MTRARTVPVDLARDAFARTVRRRETRRRSRAGVVGRCPKTDGFEARGVCAAARDGKLAELEHLCNHHGAPYEIVATLETAKRECVEVSTWAFTERGTVNGTTLRSGLRSERARRGGGITVHEDEQVRAAMDDE